MARGVAVFKRVTCFKYLGQREERHQCVKWHKQKSETGTEYSWKERKGKKKKKSQIHQWYFIQTVGIIMWPLLLLPS